MDTVIGQSPGFSTPLPKPRCHRIDAPRHYGLPHVQWRQVGRAVSLSTSRIGVSCPWLSGIAPESDVTQWCGVRVMSGLRDFHRDWCGWSKWERSGAVVIGLLLITVPSVMFLMVHPS